MNAWKWWSWCFLLILQLTKADEIPPTESLLKEDTSSHTDSTTHQERQRRDSEWAEEVAPYRENDGALTDQSTELTKRNPILSRWGGQRLSDLLYFKRRPAFSSWGGKRGPAFSSWGGKRSMPDNDFQNTKVNEANSTDATEDLESDSSSLPSRENNPDVTANYNNYEFLKNEILKGLETSDKQLHTAKAYNDGVLRNSTNNEIFYSPHKTQSFPPTENKLLDYYNNNDFLSNNSEDYDNEDEDYSTDNSAQDFEHLGILGFENTGADSGELPNKRASPSFNSWGGKRAFPLIWSSKWIPEFNHWQGSKKATAFNSWGGKRDPAFNSWGGKRSPAFNSWGGKRDPAFNSWGGKRTPAFSSWGGKRSPAFNSWGGKRISEYNLLTDDQEENNWENILEPEPNLRRGKRSITLPDMKDDGSSGTDPWEEDEYEDNINEKRATAFNSWGGKRATAFNSWGGKRAPAFNSWGGKKSTAFNSWGGKRTPAFNSWGGKRAPAFNSWGGKRTPAFNSWGGKRAPAFNSWGGKRAPAFNSWGGKRAPAFNSWGGKRAPAFNSWGGKRAPAFNSWGGKRAPAFNSWGGKRSPAFNSWGGKRTPFEDSENDDRSEVPAWENEQEPSYYSTESKRYSDDSLDDKRATSFNKGSGKRLPAFHSWGGKRFKSLTTLTPNENKINFLGSGTDQNHPFQFYKGKYNTDDISTTIKHPEGTDNNVMSDLEYIDAKDDNDCNSRPHTDESKIPLFEKNGNENIESANNVIKHRFQSVNEDNESMKNPITVGWNIKRTDMLNTLYENDKMIKKNINSLSSENHEAFPNNYNENENMKVKKRNLDGYLSHSGKSSYTDKRRPIFTSWGGKRSVLPFHNDKFNSDDDNDHHVRKKRFIGSEAENTIALIMSDGVTGTGSNFMDEMYSMIPTGMTMCCIKRAQYGDRNLFMQMLLRTKSFRDLSWPTIRPIRRGADFYPWGGKRSSL